MIDSLVSAGPPIAGLPNLREGKGSRGEADKGTFDGMLGENARKEARSEQRAQNPRGESANTSPPNSRDRISQREVRGERKPEENPESKKSQVGQQADERVGKNTKARTREQAIEEFMDSFESELGIPATRLVAAIAELSPSEKTATPEVTAEKVVKSLGLDPEEEKRAQALYASLLGNLQQITNQQRMPEIVPQQGEQFMLNRQEARGLALQNKKMEQKDSIAAVTQSFWQKPSESQAVDQGALRVQEMNTPLRKSMIENDFLSAAKVQNRQLDSEFQLPEHLMSEIEQLEYVDEAGAQGKNTLLPLKDGKKGIPVEEMTPFALSGMITKKERVQSLRESILGDLNSEEGNALEEQALVPEAVMTAQEGSLQDEFGAQNFGQNTERPDAKIKLEAGKSSAHQLGEGGDLLTQPRLGEIDFEQILSKNTPLRMPTEAEQEINNQQLLNQAKTLMSKGGGEVKVRMTPEGMGSIQLKVMMQDGKMQIQMQADNKQAKSALESSLADLKTSLAAHKLSVDNIKVDVVSATSTETATQNQNFDQGQREARQFWNNFNENFGNQAKRNSFFDSPTGRGYKAKTAPLEPIQVSSTSSKPRAVEGKGRGLNLVA